MISLTRLLTGVQTIKARSPTYKTGGTGKNGTCDCVGMLMGAMQEAGHSKYPMHSSNYFARCEMDSLDPIYSAGDCFLGMVVYKFTDSTDNLNARYLSGGRYYTGDERDYYHVGIVTSMNPLNITHCTSGGGADGIIVDTKIGKWSCGGRLKDVDYDDYQGGDIPMALQFAVVTSDNGLAVKLRSSKSAKNEANVVVKLPVGTTVRIQENGDEWSRVECSYSGQAYSGFMMTKFLEPTDEAPDTGDDGTDDYGSEEETPVSTSGYGIWIPCNSLEAAKALKNILSTGVIKAGE